MGIQRPYAVHPEAQRAVDPRERAIHAVANARADADAYNAAANRWPDERAVDANAITHADDGPADTPSEPWTKWFPVVRTRPGLDEKPLRRPARLMRKDRHTQLLCLFYTYGAALCNALRVC